MRRATNVEELLPLLALCRQGRLFEVQEWIRQHKPVALPTDAPGKAAPRNPLRVAMETGFHSLVHVLLQAGAPIKERRYNALEHAVELRRPDLVQLLFEHGGKANALSMRRVIEGWNAQIVDLFIAHGASLTTDQPVAWGLVNTIRPALGLVKRFGAEQPQVMRQAELALRHHAAEGNSKWLSLLLWAGADPMARGPEAIDSADDATEEEEYRSAVEIAISHCKLEVLERNKKLLPAAGTAVPHRAPLLERACWFSSDGILELLLARGHTPDLLPAGGTRAISSMLSSMSMGIPARNDYLGSSVRGVDSPAAMEQMRRLHVLVAHGAKWLPDSDQAIASARKCLLKLAPKYTLEFVWLMQEYRAARRDDVGELLRTPAMARWMGEERGTAGELLVRVAESVTESVACGDAGRAHE